MVSKRTFEKILNFKQLLSINQRKLKQNREFFAISPIMAIFAKKYSAPSDMCRKTSSGKTCARRNMRRKTSNKKNDREHGKTAEKD